jgi:hypothetical protein
MLAGKEKSGSHQEQTNSLPTCGEAGVGKCLGEFLMKGKKNGGIFP